MDLMVSNYGMRLLQQVKHHPDEPLPLPPGLLTRLLDVRIATSVPAQGEPWEAELQRRGVIQPAPEGADEEAIELRYRRNPLEHIERFVFEYTTVCNLDCDHCRNGHLEPATESRPERLCEAVDLAVPLGIRRFDFIGGEVTLYGARWLRVVEHIKKQRALACVITSGWFLGERGFKAAGERFADDAEYLARLAGAGLTHVIFSLDGPAHLHDRWRKVPGLYERVLRGFDKVRAAGMEPRVSLVVSPTLLAGEADDWMASVSQALHGLPASLPRQEKLQKLLADDINYISHFIDTGNAVQLRRGRRHLGAWPDEQLRCKNFFRPYPSLRIQATGEVSLCPLVDSGEGYGNLRERSLLSVLNGLQDAFVFKLHAEHKIADYRRFVDPDVFGGRFDHLCGLRTVLSMVARRMHERGVSEGDAEAIREINLEVARKAGFLPAAGRTGNGTRRPSLALAPGEARRQRGAFTCRRPARRADRRRRPCRTLRSC